MSNRKKWDFGSQILDNGVDEFKIYVLDDLLMTTNNEREVVVFINSLLWDGVNHQSIRVERTNVKHYSILLRPQSL